MEREGREKGRDRDLKVCLSVCLPIQEVMETEQMRQVSSAIQDLDNQIEEQKLKIQNTPNTNLRVSYVDFLYDSNVHIPPKVAQWRGGLRCRVCLHGRLVWASV